MNANVANIHIIVFSPLQQRTLNVRWMYKTLHKNQNYFDPLVYQITWISENVRCMLMHQQVRNIKSKSNIIWSFSEKSVCIHVEQNEELFEL